MPNIRLRPENRETGLAVRLDIAKQKVRKRIEEEARIKTRAVDNTSIKVVESPKAPKSGSNNTPERPDMFERLSSATGLEIKSSNNVKTKKGRKSKITKLPESDYNSDIIKDLNKFIRQD